MAYAMILKMEILARAVGRRKEAVAQVQIIKGTGKFIINNKSAEEYLQNGFSALIAVKAPFNVLEGHTDLTNKKLENGQTVNPVTPELEENKTTSQLQKIDTIVKVKGGGLIGQAEAIKLGIARAICDLATSQQFKELLSHNSITTPNVLDVSLEITTKEKETTEIVQNITTIRKELKTKGYLTQDSRVKERRKYGLKKARKAPQYHKR